MIWLLLAIVVALLFVAGLRAFEQASITTLKSLGTWVLGLGGLTLALILILSGRLFLGLVVLIGLGSLVWRQVSGMPGLGRPRSAGGGMTVAEAYEVLGLRPGVSEAEIREAHRRLMIATHPDHGGSDWLATRINQARDVLLG